MAEITKIYFVRDDKDYKYLMIQLEDRGYMWQESWGSEKRNPTTKSFNPEWTWGFPVLVHLYDDKTITYEPTEEDYSYLPEEYDGLVEEYNGWLGE